MTEFVVYIHTKLRKSSRCYTVGCVISGQRMMDASVIFLYYSEDKSSFTCGLVVSLQLDTEDNTICHVELASVPHSHNETTQLDTGHNRQQYIILRTDKTDLANVTAGYNSKCNTDRSGIGSKLLTPDCPD